MGVMINMLSGNKETVDALKQAWGNRILSLTLKDDTINVLLVGGDNLTLWDDGQSCCESRYITTSDNLEDFNGATLKDVELRDAPNQEGDYDAHEVQFLVLVTSKGNVTFETHNIHNGYYGGFSVQARISKND